MGCGYFIALLGWIFALLGWIFAADQITVTLRRASAHRDCSRKGAGERSPQAGRERAESSASKAPALNGDIF
jgi:hypothetical protein